MCAALERADRGAVTVTTTLGLVTRDLHTRVLHLPTPLDDPAVLRTLVLLDLEAHPPPAAIDVIELAADPAPRRILQRSLLDRAGLERKPDTSSRRYNALNDAAGQLKKRKYE